MLCMIYHNDTVHSSGSWEGSGFRKNCVSLWPPWYDLILKTAPNALINVLQCKNHAELAGRKVNLYENVCSHLFSLSVILTAGGIMEILPWKQQCQRRQRMEDCSSTPGIFSPGKRMLYFTLFKAGLLVGMPCLHLHFCRVEWKHCLFLLRFKHRKAETQR